MPRAALPDRAQARSRFPRWARIALLPLLALLTLGAWIFASPIGAAPDDDFHLVSTWCANPLREADFCAPGIRSDGREVPRELTDIACYAAHPQVSATCQTQLFAHPERTEQTRRGNFAGTYPPVYYAVMSVFAGGDVQLSALVMRLVTVLLFLGITAALYALLPLARRPALLWMWLVTTVPLGMFLLASNNPSAWAIIGVGSSWIALLGYYETMGRRRVLLGAVFAVAVVMAAGARADAAIYAGLGILAVMILKLARTRAFLLSSVLPVVLGLVALAFFLGARQSASGLGGFGGPASTGGAGPAGVEEQLTGFGLLAYNLLNLPFLWSGPFGTWALGWLDTSLPWFVALGSLSAFVVVGFLGLGRADRRTLAVIALVLAALTLVPLYTLQAGGDPVGDQVQPRYLYPLIVLLAGLLVLAPRAGIRLTRVQAVVVGAALVLANFVALHMNLRRYVTGIDGAGVNLDAGAEWWWTLPVGPQWVWLIGSLAYGALVVLLVRPLAAGREVVGPVA